MPVQKETMQRLAGVPNLALFKDVPLSRYTRFAIGGPAEVLVETSNEDAFVNALGIAQQSGAAHTVIGGGTNLIVSDDGFPGIVLHFTAREITDRDRCVSAAAGADLQALVDHCIGRGLRGIETMTGIPGSVGGAVYGNAGAYGHSIQERVAAVRFFDGATIRSIDNAHCQFRYRESIFKSHKDWIIFSSDLQMDAASPADLQTTADGILKVRLEKYPADMKCAGSIFKNLILAELPDSVQRQVPERVVREGKVASAFFLEQVDAKGMQDGDIHVATYHANLIYNIGHGTARQVCAIIQELKQRVLSKFGLALEEEVQYVGQFASLQ